MVNVVVTLESFTLVNEKEATEPLSVDWHAISSHTCTSNTVVLTYDDNEDITIETQYAAYLNECIAKVKEELAWTQQLADGDSSKDARNWFVEQ